jgi:hypothetical protein
VPSLGARGVDGAVLPMARLVPGCGPTLSPPVPRASDPAWRGGWRVAGAAGASASMKRAWCLGCFCAIRSLSALVKVPTIAQPPPETVSWCRMIGSRPPGTWIEPQGQPASTTFERSASDPTVQVSAKKLRADLSCSRWAYRPGTARAVRPPCPARAASWRRRADRQVACDRLAPVEAAECAQAAGGAACGHHRCQRQPRCHQQPRCTCARRVA